VTTPEIFFQSGAHIVTKYEHKTSSQAWISLRKKGFRIRQYCHTIL